MPQLDTCSSLTECLDRVRTEAAKAPAQGMSWVRLTGARVESWREKRWPTLDELDRAADGRPCAIMSFDHHAAVANSAALTISGLSAGAKIGVNGQVCADPRTGRASGLLLEDAAYAAWKSAPQPGPSEREAFVVAALEQLSGFGFTEVHDLHSQDWLGPVLGGLDRRGGVPISVRLYPAVEHLPTVHRSRAAWETDRVRLAGGKVFADGTLNSRTALMQFPYREPVDAASTCGRAMLSPHELEAAVRLTESLGLHLAIHAIGDAAVRMSLDAIERAGSRGRVEIGNRHRIEHCELIDRADVARFARLQVVCSVQPCHLLADIDVLVSQLSHRLDRVLPLRELIDSGCTPAGVTHEGLLWFGSDVPIVRPDPADSIQAAVRRRRLGMDGSQAIAPEQSISESEAWACFGGSGARHSSNGARS